MVWLGFKGRFGFRAQVLGDLGSFFRRGSVGFLNSGHLTGLSLSTLPETPFLFVSVWCFGVQGFRP